MQRFQYQELEVENDRAANEIAYALRLIFDPVGITNLLNQLSLPQWSNNRPEVLLWIAVGDQRFRLMLGPDYQAQLQELLIRYANRPLSGYDLSTQETSPVIDSEQDEDDLQNQASEAFLQLYLSKIGTEEDLLEGLRDIAQTRGLPIILPLLDLQDNMSLNSADVWGQFVELIRLASERYQPDTILAGRVELVQDGWLMDWLLMDETNSEIWQDSADTLSEALNAGIEQTIVRIAERFAVLQDESQSQTIEIAIRGVDSITDMAELENYLKAQASIADLYVSRVTSDEIHYRIILLGDFSSLIQSIRLEQRLVEINPVTNSLTPELSQLPKPTAYFQWNSQ